MSVLLVKIDRVNHSQAIQIRQEIVKHLTGNKVDFSNSFTPVIDI